MGAWMSISERFLPKGMKAVVARMTPTSSIVF
jgi:hypothetical protein